MARAPLRAAASLRRAWRRRPAAGRTAAALFALALLLLGAGGLALQLALPRLLPSALDWEAAGALLERDARPGDAVAVAPAWAERARAVVPPRMPVLAQRRLSGAELDGVRRVWLLSLPKAPGFSWQIELDLVALASSAEPPLAVGRLEVSRYEVAHPALPLARLGERLGEAAVRMGGQPCSTGSAGFRCTVGKAVATVEGAVVEVDGVPRSCLVTRASGDAPPVAVTFPPVPLGRELRGNAGLLPGAGADVPIALAVRVDGEEVGAVELDGAGWPAFRVDTSRWGGQRRSITLELSVPEGRALCLQAVTMP